MTINNRRDEKNLMTIHYYNICCVRKISFGLEMVREIYSF
jgi:hypothetical protein